MLEKWKTKKKKKKKKSPTTWVHAHQRGLAEEYSEYFIDFDCFQSPI